MALNCSSARLGRDIEISDCQKLSLWGVLGGDARRGEQSCLPARCAR